MKRNFVFLVILVSVVKFMLSTVQLVFTAPFSAVWAASTGDLGITYLFLQEYNMGHSSAHVNYVAYSKITSVQRHAAK